jgi:hypothetical protein
MYRGSGTAKRVGIEPATFAVSSTCLKIQGHISFYRPLLLEFEHI